MQAIWVLENIKGDKSFYNELDSLLLLASVAQFRLHNNIIEDFILYCDEMTKEHIQYMNAQNFFTEIKILPKNKFIDKSVFWASSKLEVLRTVNKPTIVLDNDFIVYKNLIGKDTPISLFAHQENGEGYYPTRYDPYIREVSDLINTPDTKAINCCFNYFSEPKIANGYARLSLELMSRFTQLKVQSSKYLIFAEQLALSHFLDYHNIPYDLLLKGTWMAKDRVWKEQLPGRIPIDEMNLHFRHYWMDKPLIRESSDGFDYNEEIRTLRVLVNRFNKSFNSNAQLRIHSEIPI